MLILFWLPMNDTDQYRKSFAKNPLPPLGLGNDKKWAADLKELERELFARHSGNSRVICG